mmetsp:Transcript_6681/g.16214  ORF Transcript_6681/g.16214 Transcript_6681/m.16214 type:complete len:285 (+) Transcript_6681:25-879(+)
MEFINATPLIELFKTFKCICPSQNTNRACSGIAQKLKPLHLNRQVLLKHCRIAQHHRRSPGDGHKAVHNRLPARLRARGMLIHHGEPRLRHAIGQRGQSELLVHRRGVQDDNDRAPLERFENRRVVRERRVRRGAKGQLVQLRLQRGLFFCERSAHDAVRHTAIGDRKTHVFKEENSVPDRLGVGHRENFGVRFSQRDETPVIRHHIVPLDFPVPVDLVDFIGRLVTVLDAVLGAAHLLAHLHEGHSLGREDHDGAELVHPHQIALVKLDVIVAEVAVLTKVVV